MPHNMMPRSAATSLFATMALMLAAAGPSFGITWCHDYVYNVISGLDSNGLSPNKDPAKTAAPYKNGLRGELAARGYTQVNGVLFTLTGQPTDSSHLQDGDVLLFGEAHSGVVVDDKGHINHFIQKYGANNQGIAYTIARAETEYDPILHTDLLRRGWTLDQVRNFQWDIPPYPPPPYKNLPIQVWRPNLAALMIDWAWESDDRFGKALLNTFGGNPNGLDATWTLNWMQFEWYDGGTVWLYIATKKAEPSVRYVKFWDPDDGGWSDWEMAYKLHTYF